MGASATQTGLPMNGASVSAESPPSVGIPSADLPWWAGDNEEFFKVGPYATREDALAEAWSYFGEDSDIYLLQAELAEWSAPSASSVIDMMIDNSDELFFEDGFDDMVGTKEAIAAAEAELDALLAGWLGKHRDIFPNPTSFGRTGKRDFVASAMSASGQDAEERLEAKPASAVGDSRDAPTSSGASA